MNKHYSMSAVEQIIRKYHTIDRQGFIVEWNPVRAAAEIDELYRSHEALSSDNGREVPAEPLPKPQRKEEA